MFSNFRRNQRIGVALLIFVAILAFVVAPILQQYVESQQSAASGANEAVVSYSGGDITRAELSRFQRMHNTTYQFLVQLAEMVAERGGQPAVPGFAADPRTGQIFPGISVDSSVESAVVTLLHSERAEELGFELDDVAIDIWLERYASGQVSGAEMQELLREVSGSQMGRSQLYDHLRTHLQSQLLDRLALAGLEAGQSQLATPDQLWHEFKKINQRATVSTFPVLVSSYVDEVADPTEEQIAALYEEYKDQLSNPDSPEPGFRQRYAANVEYLAARFDDFIQREAESISEETLRQEYERRAALGQYDVDVEEATDTTEAPAGDSAESDASENADSSESAAPSEGEDEDAAAADSASENTEPGTESSEPAVTEEPATDPSAAAEEAPESDSPPAEEPAADAPEATTEDQPTETAEGDNEAGEQPEAGNETDQEPAATEETGDETEGDKPDAADQSSLGRRATRLTLFQDESQDDSAAEGDEAAEAENADTQSQSDAAEDASGEEAADSQPEAEGKEGAADKTSPPSAESAEDSEDSSPDSEDADNNSPAEEQTAPDQEPADDNATTTADPATEAAAAEEPAQRTQTFEEVRDELASEMARPQAFEKLQSTLNQVRNEMLSYFAERDVYEKQRLTDPNVEEPQKPDLEKMAEETGLEYGETGMQTALSIVDYDIADSRSGRTGQGDSFRNLVYNQTNPLYAPLESSDGFSTSYVFWKTDAREAYTPSLEEVREEVIAAYKLQQARELAEARATEIAEKARNSDEPLLEVVPETGRELVLETVGPFSWMLSFGQFADPILSNVPDLDRVGEEFMRAVFAHETGDVVVAPNSPETVYYVTDVLSISPTNEALQTQFLQQPQRQQAAALVRNEVRDLYFSWFQSVDEEMGVRRPGEEPR